METHGKILLRSHGYKINQQDVVVIIILCKYSSCARSARYAILVLDARCAHFVIAHFNYFVLWSSASLAPTQHICLMTNLCVNITVIAIGTVVHAHIQGRRQLDLVLLLSGLCNTTLTHMYCNPHTHAHYW